MKPNVTGNRTVLGRLPSPHLVGIGTSRSNQRHTVCVQYLAARKSDVAIPCLLGLNPYCVDCWASLPVPEPIPEQMARIFIREKNQYCCGPGSVHHYAWIYCFPVSPD